MHYVKYMLLLLPYLVTGKASHAQDITGTWEGSLGNDQFLQVNVIQVKDKLCGYTWDYILKDRKSYCKAYFTGTYDKKRKEWNITGQSFIVDSVDHSLMTIYLWQETKKGKVLLSGFETANADKAPDNRNPFISLLDSLMDIPLAPFPRNREEVVLEKVAEMPSQITQQMQDCMDEYLSAKAVVLKPKDIATGVVRITPGTDTVIASADTASIAASPAARTTKEIAHITSGEKKISLAIYDNAVIDGDTVSIIYNDKLIMSHQRLSDKPITIDIDLNAENNMHKIVLFAENLGSIPPNTALIIVTAGNKRYELFSKASLTENAMLVFEYKPDP